MDVLKTTNNSMVNMTVVRPKMILGFACPGSLITVHLRLLQSSPYRPHISVNVGIIGRYDRIQAITISIFDPIRNRLCFRVSGKCTAINLRNVKLYRLFGNRYTLLSNN